MILNFKNSQGRFYDFISDIKKYKSLESYMTGLQKFVSDPKVKQNMNFIPTDFDINDVPIIKDDDLNMINFNDMLKKIKKLPSSKKMFDDNNIEINASGYDRRLSIKIKL